MAEDTVQKDRQPQEGEGPRPKFGERCVSRFPG